MGRAEGGSADGVSLTGWGGAVYNVGKHSLTVSPALREDRDN